MESVQGHALREISRSMWGEEKRRYEHLLDELFASLNIKAFKRFDARLGLVLMPPKGGK